jgi:hypothetical protein
MVATYDGVSLLLLKSAVVFLPHTASAAISQVSLLSHVFATLAMQFCSCPFEPQEEAEGIL